MVQSVVTQVLTTIIQILIVTVGGYVINYLRTKVGSENLTKYYELTRNVVMSVEQTFGAGNGPDKKAEAIQLIKKITNNKLSDEQINTFLEAAVFQMNTLLKDNGISQ